MAKIISNYNLIGIASTYTRLNGQPLDDTEVWDFLEDVKDDDDNVIKQGAKSYAKTDAAYVGQTIKVMETRGTEEAPIVKIISYVIADEAGTLVELGEAEEINKIKETIGSLETYKIKPVTALSGEDLESAGIVKYDIVSLRNDENKNSGLYRYNGTSFEPIGVRYTDSLDDFDDPTIGQLVYVGGSGDANGLYICVNNSDPAEFSKIATTKDIGSISGGGVFTNKRQPPEAVGGIKPADYPNGFTNKTLQEMFDALLYPYEKPKISASFDPYTGTREMNTPVTVESASVTVTKTSKTIESVILLDEYDNVITADETYDEELEEGSRTYKYTIGKELSGTSGTWFTVRVKEEGLQAKDTRYNYSFAYPKFYGCVKATDTIESDLILEFDDRVATGHTTKTYVTQNSRPCIASPKALTKITYLGTIEIEQKWDVTEINILEEDGNIYSGTVENKQPVHYYVYTGAPSTTTATYKFEFER